MPAAGPQRRAQAEADHRDDAEVQPGAGHGPQHAGSAETHVQVQAVDRLVEHERRWVAQQRGGDAEPLAHAEREAAHPPARDAGQPDPVEAVLHPAPVQAVAGREPVQVPVRGAPAVQAAYGRLVVGTGPAEAAGALAAIETTGRQSLVELRRLLAVLRAGEPGPPEDEPVPGLADLPRLAERTGQAGVRVEVCVRGEVAALGPGLELSAYRIVQEALTNVVKHAGTDSARVTVEHRPDAVVLDIVDRGRGGDVRQEGHGLPGMREPAALYGGTLRAGPAPGGGFRVSAVLPRPADGAP